MDYYLLAPFLLFSVIFIYLVYRQRKFENSIDVRFEESNRKIEDLHQNVKQGVENAVLKTFQSSSGVFESIFTSAISKNTEAIKGAFATSLQELGIQEDLGSLKDTSRDLKSLTSDLKSMFEIKQSRAKFGELQLESLLKDLFPSSRLRFQHSIADAGTPDACIKVQENRHLCIDSKFPLENLKRFGDAENEKDREKFWNKFLRDVEKHVNDINKKYVGKEITMDFAFMYVPSDTIYYQLASDAPDVIVEASKRGVVLASPSILPAYLNLISAGIRAEEISEKAEQIQRKIARLEKYMDEVEDVLEKSNKHLNRASKSMGKTIQSFNEMRSYFSSISGLEVEE